MKFIDIMIETRVVQNLFSKTFQSKQSRSSPILLPHIARSPDGATSIFSALDYNIRIGSGLATVQSAKDPVSYCYLNQDIHLPMQNGYMVASFVYNSLI